METNDSGSTSPVLLGSPKLYFTIPFCRANFSLSLTSVRFFFESTLQTPRFTVPCSESVFLRI